MIWKFFKTNWFYLAMCVVLFLYAARKYPALNLLNVAFKNAQTERGKEGKGEVKSGAALLGFVPDNPKERVPETLELNASKVESFLKRFAKVAFSEHKKFGVPTSVILACAYVNSKSGLLEPASTANNFFALTCDGSWEGETDQINGQCMRKYDSAWASFRDFSIYLSSQEWFGMLKKTAGKDWRKWVEKLELEGVSNSKEMTKVIEAYRLEEMDL
jgi:hypothetical protein